MSQSVITSSWQFAVNVFVQIYCLREYRMMTITQHGTRWPGQQNTVVYSTQGVKKKNFLCAESLSSSQSHVPLFFFTSSWLESEVCSIFVCFWCVCGWSKKYSYYIVFKSCSKNESYIVWCFMMLIQIIIMLISYFE